MSAVHADRLTSETRSLLVRRGADDLEGELTKQAAYQAFIRGHEVIPAVGKRTVIRNFQEKEPMDWPELSWWFTRFRLNYGICLRGAGGRVPLVVLDKDAANKRAYAFMREHRAHRSPMEVKTSHGVHFYFRLPAVKEVRSRIKFLGMPLDILMGNRFTLGPGNLLDSAGFRYEIRKGTHLVPPAELPELPASLVSLLNESARPTLTRVEPLATVDATVNRVRKYVSFITARCHSGAHNQAYRAACKIADVIRDFDLAMQVYREWNATNAVAEDGVTLFPFDEAALQHKMRDAFGRKRAC